MLLLRSAHVSVPMRFASGGAAAAASSRALACDEVTTLLLNLKIAVPIIDRILDVYCVYGGWMSSVADHVEGSLRTAWLLSTSIHETYEEATALQWGVSSAQGQRRC